MGISFFQKLQKRDRNFHVLVDGDLLPVTVKENARAKRLILRLDGSFSLKLTTPPHIGDDALEAFVERNRGWIENRIIRQACNHKIEHGAQLPFLGVPHHLKFSQGTGRVRRLEDEGRAPVFHVPSPNKTHGAKLLAHLKREARMQLDQSVIHYTKLANVRAAKLRITDTKSRWGSCSSNRTLSFSWRVVMAPKPVLDYLVAHEVAHLTHMNHSRQFWTHVRELCPDYRIQEAWLKREGEKLMAMDFS